MRWRMGFDETDYSMVIGPVLYSDCIRLNGCNPLVPSVEFP